jgi:hypothetical protein
MFRIDFANSHDCCFTARVLSATTESGARERQQSIATRSLRRLGCSKKFGRVVIEPRAGAPQFGQATAFGLICLPQSLQLTNAMILHTN